MASSRPLAEQYLLPRPFDTQAWLRSLTESKGKSENNGHFWAENTTRLISSSHADVLQTGSGKDIYLSTLLPAIEAADHEVILVTCFWARSDTLTHLSAVLLKLSQKALARSHESKIGFKICFSSRSLLQTLFHTSSKNGYVYRPEEWSTKLGLPHRSKLQGLDLEVKSLFFRPFSVMHPKFVIVDRTRAFIPSCNVSWEVWLECCLSLRGQIVASLVSFWRETWDTGNADGVLSDSVLSTLLQTNEFDVDKNQPVKGCNLLSSFPVVTILLPSPHHSTMRHSIAVSSLSPPVTPLNTFVLLLLSSAQTSIQIITPNLTSPPVITALLDALERGVCVHIITNRRMMVLEQLLTAGTITEVAIWKLIRRYKARCQKASLADLEEARSLGRLRIDYYRPNTYQKEQPVKVHAKCTVVDGHVAVLGSGNMDRASWYTSQELGIALFEKESVAMIWNALSGELVRNVETMMGSLG